jgi:hypothetical protein
VIVMPSNNTGAHARELSATYPGRIGNLLSPGGWRAPINECYALDNGRYPAWASGKEWGEAEYLAFLLKAAAHEVAPQWALVPDCVGDCLGTLREWERWAPQLKEMGWPLAFAVQDGMVKENVPTDAEVIFIGGTTGWKRRTLFQWCNSFPRVHVGRINTKRWLWECHKAGAESCDGTGWYRGDDLQLAGLVEYLDRSSKNLGPRQIELEFSATFLKPGASAAVEPTAEEVADTLTNPKRRIDYTKREPQKPMVLITEQEMRAQWAEQKGSTTP